jgi:hypothetical protein
VLIKKVLSILWYLWVISIVVPFAFSQGTDEVVSTKELSGKILSVELDSYTLVVEVLKEGMIKAYERITFFVDKSTSIKRGDVFLAFSDLKVGEKVSVTYIDSYGKNVASSITVQDL